MSTPDEKRRALLAVYDWLLRLPDVKRLPKEVREQAVRLLRHYPSPCEIDRFTMIGEAPLPAPPSESLPAPEWTNHAAHVNPHPACHLCKEPQPQCPPNHPDE